MGSLLGSVGKKGFLLMCTIDVRSLAAPSSFQASHPFFLIY